MYIIYMYSDLSRSKNHKIDILRRVDDDFSRLSQIWGGYDLSMGERGMNHVTRLRQLHRTFEWVASHILMCCCVSLLPLRKQHWEQQRQHQHNRKGGNESRHSHTWITHVTCAYESRHTMNVLLCTSSTASEEAGLRAAAATAEWREAGVRVTTRIWMTHVTCTNESRLTYAAMYIIACL